MKQHGSLIISLLINIKRIKKNIKNVTRCRDRRSAKGIEEGRDDSIKQFKTPP